MRSSQITSLCLRGAAYFVSAGLLRFVLLLPRSTCCRRFLGTAFLLLLVLLSALLVLGLTLPRLFRDRVAVIFLKLGTPSTRESSVVRTDAFMEKPPSPKARYAREARRAPRAVATNPDVVLARFSASDSLPMSARTRV